MQTETLPYAQIPRNFWGSDSPFLSHKRDSARKVIECLICNAKFTPEIPILDIVRMSIRMIAKISMTSIAAVRRALIWLETQGYLSIITKDPTMTIRLLGKAHPYLYKREVAKANRHTPQEPPKEPETGTPETGTPETGTPETGTPGKAVLPSEKGTLQAQESTETGTPLSETGTLPPETGTPDINVGTKTGTPPTETGTPEAYPETSKKACDFNSVSSGQVSDKNQTGTPPTETGTPLNSGDNSVTYQDDCVKNTAENGSKTKPAHFRDFSRDIYLEEERERDTSPSFQTGTPKQAHPKTADNKRANKRSRKERVIGEEYDTAPKLGEPENEAPFWKAANAYAEGLRRATGLPRAKMRVREWKDDFRHLQEKYGWTFEEMDLVIAARWAHPWWSGTATHPWTLSEPYGNSDDPWMEISKWAKKKEETPKADPRNGNIPYVDEDGVTWLAGKKLISKNS